MFEWIINGGGVPEKVFEYAADKLYPLDSEGWGIDVTSDGMFLASDNQINGGFRLHRFINGEFTQIYSNSSLKGSCVAINGIARVAVAGDMDAGKINVVSFPTDRSPYVLESFSGYKYLGASALFSNDGEVLVAGAYGDNKVLVCGRSGIGRYGSTSTRQVLSGTGNFGQTISMAGDKSVIAITSALGGVVELFTRSSDGLYSKASQISAAGVGGLALSESGGVLAVVGNNTLRIYTRNSPGHYTEVQNLPCGYYRYVNFNNVRVFESPYRIVVSDYVKNRAFVYVEIGGVYVLTQTLNGPTYSRVNLAATANGGSVFFSGGPGKRVERFDWT